MKIFISIIVMIVAVVIADPWQTFCLGLGFFCGTMFIWDDKPKDRPPRNQRFGAAQTKPPTPNQ